MGNPFANIVQNSPSTFGKKTKTFEGWRSKPYQDPGGSNRSIAWGFNIDEPSVATLLSPDVLAGKRDITKEEAEPIFRLKYQQAQSEAGTYLGGNLINEIPEEAKDVIVDLTYNMGYPTISEFKNLRQAIENKDWNKAADELENSNWYKQTGNRAKTHVNTLRKLALKKNDQQSSLIDFFLPSAQAKEINNPFKAIVTKDTENPFSEVIASDNSFSEISKITEDTKKKKSLLNDIYYGVQSGISRTWANVWRTPAAVYDIISMPTNFMLKVIGKPEWQAKSPDWLMNNPMAKWNDYFANEFEKEITPTKTLEEAFETKDFDNIGRHLAIQVAKNAPQQLALIASYMVGYPGTGLAGMGLLQATQALQETRDKDPAMSAYNALAQGVIEVGFESIGIGIISNWSKVLRKSFGTKNALKIIGDVFKTIINSIAGEGWSEGLTSLAQDFSSFVTGMNDKAMKGSLPRAFESAAVGAISGGLLTGPAAIGTGIKSAEYKKLSDIEQRQPENIVETLQIKPEQAEIEELKPKAEPKTIEAENALIEEAKKFGVRYSPEIKDKVIKLYSQGKSSTQISSELGISSSAILNIADKAGIKRTISQSKILYEKDIPKVIELYKQGKSIYKIGEDLSLAPSSIARWVKEAGITRTASEAQGAKSEDIIKAIDLYKSGKSTIEIGKELGYSKGAIWRWVNNVGENRSQSEARSILAEEGRLNLRSVKSSVKTKSGEIKADSAYEAARIKQLDKDNNVIEIKRAKRIPFGNKSYIPDLEIKYSDGKIIIEEIKADYKKGDENVIAKEKAAKEYYKDKNIEYRIITENDIGINAFSNIHIDDLTFTNEVDKSRFNQAIKSVRAILSKQQAQIKPSPSPGVSGVYGYTVPAGIVAEGGYGTIEPNEKATREKIAKTDYSKIAEDIPVQEFSVVDEVLKITSPAERKGALIGKKVLRKNIADLAHKDVAAVETLKKTHKAFKWMNKEDSLDFIDRVETGKTQITKELQTISDTFRSLLDGRRTDIQNLGKGHLESFVENYFPHIWKDPKKAKNVISAIMGKKRLEGTKSFLKKRVIVSVKDGVKRGLEPVSDNPVDLVLLKLHEMDRYIMAQNIIKELKTRGLIKFVYSRGGKKPDGYVTIDDNAFTVYMPPEITKKDYYDQIVVDQMVDIARSLDIDTKRFVSIGGKRVGYAQWFPGQEKGEKIRTKFASPESVLAHEIGHILGIRYNLYALLGRRNDGEWKVHKAGKSKGKRYFSPSKEAIEYRRKIDSQWRALSDARAKGLDPKKYPGFYKYIRNAREKEAVMLEAMIHAPNEFRRAAPDLYKVFTAFLNSHAELRPILDIRSSLVLGENEAKIKVPGFTTLGRYYVPEPVGTLLNNYLSSGLRNNKNKLVSSGYNILRGAGNVLNQAQLAFSLFHGLNVTSDMAASTFGLGLRRMFIKGQRFKGITDILSVPVAPIMAIWNGTRIRKAYTQQLKSITDPKMRQMVEAIIAAGGRDRMDTFYYNNQIKALEQTFKDIVKGNAFTKVKSSLKLPFNLFGATLEMVAKPLMEWYVPTGKIGLFSKLAQHEMERAEAGQISQEQLWERLTQVWDSVDNRMGQLIYDNLFWEKTMKDTLMLSIRSVGWNLGSWREFGGSAVDIVTTQERINRGDIWLSHKMAYTIGAITIYAALGAMIQYILTGEPPEEARDYFFPKTGKKNPDESDERISLPTYAKDWYAWSHQPVKTLIHKVHPLWGLVGDLATNKDYFNVEVRHTDDSLLKQANQAIAHIGESFKSISLRNYEKMERVSPRDKRNFWISITGISSAPSYITKSPAQKLMTRLIVERIPPKAKTKEQFERSTYRRTLKNRLRKGERIDNNEARKILGMESYKRLRKEAEKSPFADSFNRLGIKDALSVYTIATKEERRQVRKILRGKYNRAKPYTKTKDIRDLYRELIF